VPVLLSDYYSKVVTILITSFNNERIYIIPIDCIYVFLLCFFGIVVIFLTLVIQ